ncbi:MULTISPECIES: Ig-like domain-containing protein [unclassified Granulicatella]|uniref:Ig-like domain-containing protein n=1 Tax=unclassified Granulicatella TaxID=2630493 RepID=UPI002555726A|nr:MULTISPECIES: Ig-like domain-containing protein [unclassified Granulicatella]MDK8381092.1 peptidase [Granulicatella sp. UMB5615B]MDK8522131.1 peptidase [Granulicatella sp. UMB5615A]
MKSSFKKTVAFVAMIAWAILGLTLMQPVNAATVTPTVSNLKATAAGQKVTFSFDWDLTGKSVKEGDTFTIDAPEGVNITEIATQSLQANGAEVATVSMTGKKITFTFKKAIESMNQNVKGGFSYKAEWDNTPGNPGNKTATSKVGSESVVITRPDGPGVFESVINKYNLTGDYVSKQFKLDASENYAWMNVGDDYYLTKWFIRINGDGKKQALTNPVVTDRIQAPAVDYSKITFAPAANHAASEFFVGTYLKPSFTLRKGGQVVASGWDFWKHVKFDADGNGFTVNLSDVSDVFKTATDEELIIEYQTLIPKTTIRVDNNATLKSDEITTPQEDPAFWNNTELKFWVTGDTTVTVQKEWVGDSEADRKDITVQLVANGQKLDGMTKTLTKGSDWKAEFTNLPGIKDGKKIEYSVEEVNTPDGYTSKVEKIDDSNVIKVVNTSNKPTTTTTEATTTTESTTESTTAATTTTEATTVSTTAATTTTESTTAATTAATTTTESTTAATTAATTTTESSTVSTTVATTTTEATTASTTAATTEGSTTGNTTTVVAPTPGTTTTTPSPELPNTGSIRDAYWVLSAIFATIGAIVFVTNKKAEEK